MSWPSGTLWITWHEHRRTRSLVDALGGMTTRVFDDHRPLQRNTIGPLWTVWTLVRERPRLVFLHFSYLLMLVCVLYKTLSFGRRVVLVCDCHNKALRKEMDGPLGGLFAAVKRWLLGSADLLVVTNQGLVPYARRYNPRTAVLRDPLTDWKGADEAWRSQDARPEERPHVFFVCSFDRDEPVDLVFDAALAIVRSLDLDVVITGNPARVDVPPDVEASDRIRLPGWLETDEYLRLLSRAEAVVVLTEDPDCLVCGAYEAVGASRGTVLSDTTALVECFGDCAIYVGHELPGFTDAVARARTASSDPDALAEARLTFVDRFTTELQAFVAEVRALSTKEKAS